MAKTIEQLKAQGAQVKNATVVGENTATRVGTLFTDIVDHVEQYEAEQTADTEANTLAINQEAQARAKADEQLNTAIAVEKERAEAAEKANADNIAKNAQAITDEVARAQEAELANTTAIENEINRAKAAEKANAENIVENAQTITDEVVRAKAAEEAIIYDVSTHNGGAVFESIQALFSSSNLDALIPTSVRHGGMTIRFIQGSEQSSDNKYVQFRYMGTDVTTAATFTNVANWQGVDDKPALLSKNLVESGAVYIEENKTNVRVDDIEAKTYNLVGHNTNISFVASLILNEHSTGYYNLKSSVPVGKTITAVKVNGQDYNGSLYIKFETGNDDSVVLNTSDLPLSYSRAINRVRCTADVYHVELVYTEPPVEGVIKDIRKTLVNRESYQNADLYLLSKESFSFRNYSYIDSDGNFQSNRAFVNYGFYCDGLLEITCKVGSNGGAGYAVAFYSSESVFDSTTFISEGSVKHNGGILNSDVMTIPNNAKVVFVNNRVNSLPLEQMELSLKYECKSKYESAIKVNLMELNSICQTEQDLYLKVTTGIGIDREKGLGTPLFCKQGDTVNIIIENDVSSLLANSTINGYLAYSDGTYSSSFTINNTTFKGVLCEKDVIALAYYTVNESVIGTGVVHLIAKVEATNVRTKVETITVANNQGFDNLNYIVNAKACECIDIRFNTEETTFEKIALYWYEPNSIQRQSLAEIKPNVNFRLYCPYPVDKIGFYAPRSEGSECTVDIVTSVHKEDMLTIPSWYTEDYLLTKENRIKELIDAANGKVITFAFVTDEHIDARAYNCKAPALIKHLCDNVNIDAVVNGGDISNGKTISIEGFIDALEKASENSLLLNVVGNHDYMEDFTDGKLYRYLYKNNYARYGNPARGYYYVDNEFQKVRFVILNAFADNGIIAKDGYEADQVQWFTNEALKTPSDWKVIVFSHCFYIVPIYNDSPYYPYRIQSRANNIITAIKANNDNNNKGKVLMCVQGHTHNDRIVSTTVTDSVPVIITTSDAVEPNLDDQGRPDHNAPREIGRISEQAFDVFVVNLETNTANIVRIGAQARDGIDSSTGDLVEERVVQL